MTAKFRGEDDHHLHVEREDGSVVSLPKAAHSQAMHDYVRSLPGTPQQASDALEALAQSNAAANYVPRMAPVGVAAPAMGEVSDSTMQLGPDGKPVVTSGNTMAAPQSAIPIVGQDPPTQGEHGHALTQSPEAPQAAPAVAMAAPQIGMGGGMGAGYAGLRGNLAANRQNTQDAVQGVGQGQLKQAQAIQNIAASQQTQAAQETAAYASQNAQLAAMESANQQKAAFDQRVLDEAVKKNETLQADVAATRINPNAFWDSRSTLGKVGVGISIILSGLASGIAGRPGENKGLDIIEKSIADNVAEQRNALNDKRSLVHDQVNVVAMARQHFADHRSQELAATMAVRDATIRKIQETAAGSRSGEVQANAELAIGKLQEKNAIDSHALAQNEVSVGNQIYTGMMGAEMARDRDQAALQAKQAELAHPKVDNKTRLLVGKHNVLHNQLKEALAQARTYREDHTHGNVFGGDVKVMQALSQKVKSLYQQQGYSKDFTDTLPDFTSLSPHTMQQIKSMQDNADRDHMQFLRGIQSAAADLAGGGEAGGDGGDLEVADGDIESESEHE